MPITNIVPAGLTVAADAADQAGVVTDSPIAYAPKPAATHVALPATAVVTPWAWMDVPTRTAHVDACPDMCEVCENGREWGACTWCGLDPIEARVADGTSACCGSVITLGRTA